MSQDVCPIILFTIDYWASAAGGVQTVNRELAKAMARRYSTLHCACLVINASDEEIKSARQCGVELIQSGGGEHWPSPFPIDRVLDFKPGRVEVIIGHGRFSGPLAQRLREVYFPSAKYVYFVHSSPLDTEHLKEYQQNSYVKQREERLAEELAT